MIFLWSFSSSSAGTNGAAVLVDVVVPLPDAAPLAGTSPASRRILCCSSMKSVIDPGSLSVSRSNRTTCLGLVSASGLT